MPTPKLSPTVATSGPVPGAAVDDTQSGFAINNGTSILAVIDQVMANSEWLQKQVKENKYVIEMAVAGFAKQDIELEFVDSNLIIKGNVESSEDEDKNYLFKGISDRAFTRQFKLADNVEIKGADLFNGMLKIWLEAIIPEHKKPKKIEVKQK